ncbi:MAG TPA: AAA family ATPase [Candidatus Saccharimonadales bacterium]|jgi:predicted ABC-type ATPase|nr:AAA family ATPase [Candidatus Saccharimonadales bacterium]
MNGASFADHPILILVRGLPGSGKSYLTDALRRELGERAEVLDPDAVDQNSGAYHAFVEEQTREGVDPKLHLYRWSRAKAYTAIEAHKIVIWNQAFTNLDIFRKMIDRLETHAAEHGTTLPVVVVEVEADSETAQRRIAERVHHGGHDVPKDTFARFITHYKSYANEGFHVVSVSGSAPVHESVAAVLDALHAL